MTAKDIRINKQWDKMLSDQFDEPYYKKIIDFLENEKMNGIPIYPKKELIFNAFDSTPLHKVKVVILGQDPYHGPDEAMGLCFSVPREIKIPPSLKRIFKEINQDIGTQVPEHGDLSSWAKQGILLLNSVLTVRHKSPGSHGKIGWQNFTDQVIQKLSDQKEALVFMLWGNYAKSKKVFINSDKHLILESAHPSPLAGNRFFGNHHFSKCNDYLKNNGKETINWQT